MTYEVFVAAHDLLSCKDSLCANVLDTSIGTHEKARVRMAHNDFCRRGVRSRILGKQRTVYPNSVTNMCVCEFRIYCICMCVYIYVQLTFTFHYDFSR